MENIHLMLMLTSLNDLFLLLYPILASSNPHLAGLTFDIQDDKKGHHIHIILGAGEISRIKSALLISGQTGEPIAEKTIFGWALMGHGCKPSTLNYFSNRSQEDYRKLYNLDVLGIQDCDEESTLNYFSNRSQEDYRKLYNLDVLGIQDCDEESTLNYFSNRSQEDYRKLYNLDVLGIQDCDEEDQQNIYEKLKEQLQRNTNDSYPTKLPWKANHPMLHDNMSGSLARMHTQIRKLKGNNDMLNEYHEMIQDQLSNGIVEAAPGTPTGERLPDRAVIREDAETTKLRIMFDVSSKQCYRDVSLNYCLHTGPALQPHLQNVLVRNRLKKVTLLGDIKQAFLQIGIQDCDRDALRFFLGERFILI